MQWPEGIPNVYDCGTVRRPPQLRLPPRVPRQIRRYGGSTAGMGQAWTEPFFTETADHTALSSFTSEASLLAGTKLQPTIPAYWFNSRGQGIRVFASGVLGTTGTPTYTFQCRLNTTKGDANLSGNSVGVSAAIVTASGITNQYWELNLRLILRTPGIDTNNMTLSGVGTVRSPGGFASPFEYSLIVSQGALATWTQTFDASVAHYFNLSVTCQTSNAANTVTCKQLIVEGFNGG